MTVSTFSIAATGNDGSTDQGGATYPPTGTVGLTTDGQNMAVTRLLAGGNFSVSLFVCRWDTSSIPDGDDISAADFKPYVLNPRQNGDARDLVAEWMADGALATGDHTNTAGNNAHSGTSLAVANIPNNAVATLALQNLSNISKTAFTKMRVHISGGEPAALNQLGIADFWDAVNPPADLVVTHFAPLVGGGILIVSD